MLRSPISQKFDILCTFFFNQVKYNVAISANKTACHKKHVCRMDDIVIRARRYSNELPIRTTVIGAFECEGIVEVGLYGLD